MEHKTHCCNTRRKCPDYTKTLLPFALLALLMLTPPTSGQECNHVTLVECFIEVIDEFAMLLFTAKDNVVTIDSEQCKEVKRMGDCVHDLVPSKKHGCTPEQALETSKELSDLLIHRENAGTFIATYYLLKFSCEDQGREIIAKHAQCLRRERIGRLTYSATGYITETYLKPRGGRRLRQSVLEQSQKEKCGLLTERIGQYNDALQSLCPEKSAGIFMCQSIKSVINGVFKTEVGDCDIDCEAHFKNGNGEGNTVEEAIASAGIASGAGAGDTAKSQAQGLNGGDSSTPSGGSPVLWQQGQVACTRYFTILISLVGTLLILGG